VVERGPELFLVAEEGGCIVGAVIGGWDGRRGYIYHLAVLPARRGQGIATELMAEIESRLRARGAIKVNLHVEPRNRGVVEFYERRGYAVGELMFMGKELEG
jgi:ribosomal protein S18 acetylase RimI-like enzyme